MSACEMCWNEASRVSYMTRRSQVECYLEALERNEHIHRALGVFPGPEQPDPATVTA